MENDNKIRKASRILELAPLSSPCANKRVSISFSRTTQPLPSSYRPLSNASQTCLLDGSSIWRGLCLDDHSTLSEIDPRWQTLDISLLVLVSLARLGSFKP